MWANNFKSLATYKYEFISQLNISKYSLGYQCFNYKLIGLLWIVFTMTHTKTFEIFGGKKSTVMKGMSKALNNKPKRWLKLLLCCAALMMPNWADFSDHAALRVKQRSRLCVLHCYHLYSKCSRSNSDVTRRAICAR